MSDSRDRFEAWFKEELIAEQWSEEGAMFMFELSRLPGRMYSYSSTQSAWQAWQAAEAAAVRRCAEIVADDWFSARDIREEFPEAFK